MYRRYWPLFLVLGLSAFAVAGSNSTANSFQSSTLPSATLQARERQIQKKMLRSSQFSDVPHIGDPSHCDDIQPPQALTTPNPLLTPVQDHLKVEVSFIVGTDGHVHSPLILESAGGIGDRHVLQTVRTWRYRPATCNGVPTETEGKIDFSLR